MKFYPLGDQLSLEERRRLAPKGALLPSLGVSYANVHAVPTKEFREPRKGEWYLSGGQVCAYRAPNDLPTKYHIARLVKTETKTMTTIVEAT